MNEIPLGNVNYGDFIDLVTTRDVRPERPDEDDGPDFPDGVWKLAEECWAKEPKKRPNANDVCNTISRLLDVGATPIHVTVSESALTPIPPSSPVSEVKLMPEYYLPVTPLIQV